MNSVDVLVGAKLRESRSQAGLTCSHLATIIGVPTDRLVGFESGDERVPAEIMVRLCRALDVRYVDIFALEPVGLETSPIVTQSCAHPAHGWRSAADRPADADDIFHAHGKMIADQAGVVAMLERDGYCRLARVGRRLLRLMEDTRAQMLRARVREPS